MHYHYSDVIMGTMDLKSPAPRLFTCRSKKISKPHVTGLFEENSPVTCEFPHKWPVTWKMLPFDDVIMIEACHLAILYSWHTCQLIITAFEIFGSSRYNVLYSTRWGREEMAKFPFFQEWKWLYFGSTLKCVTISQIDNTSAMVQTMAWRRTGDNTLSEPMVA